MPHQLNKLTPNLVVSNVARSMAFYRDRLGFSVASIVPDAEPYVFAILFNGDAEIMLRRQVGFQRDPTLKDWDVYVRLTGGKLTELYVQLHQTTTITRRLERMPYGMTEFEITDPDGWRLCFGEDLGAT